MKEPLRDARAEMAALVAKWEIPGPGDHRTKPRATNAEMAERRAVTRWLVETAGRPLSRRGVAYRAEALLGLPKTFQAFRLIEEATLALRDDGEIPWSSIRDGRRSAIYWARWQKLSDRLRWLVKRHRLDGWQDAEVQAQLWVEKADLAGALESTASRLLIDLFPASGFTGAGFLHDAIEHAAEDGRPLVLLLLADFDSSGHRARETIEHRAATFATELDLELRAVETVALTAGQVAEHGIPTRPQKDSTHRRDDDDDVAAELDAVDALHPELLPQWITEAVDRWCPPEIRDRVLKQETIDRERLIELADELDDDE